MRSEFVDLTIKINACAVLRNELRFNFSNYRMEILKCVGKFTLFSAIFIAVGLLLSGPVLAQNTTGPSEMTGLSHSEIKAAIEPFTDIIATVIAFLAGVVAYILRSPPAAILLSASVAYFVTRFSIRSQRDTARIRQTFESIDKGIWNAALSKNRSTFRKIRESLDEEEQTVAKFQTTHEEEQIEDAAVLHTVMKDYENISLGISNNILDERYLYAWMRNTVVTDWAYLSPLVTALRTKKDSPNPNAYIEFENLAKAWQRGQSYATGKKIRLSKMRLRKKKWFIV